MVPQMTINRLLTLLLLLVSTTSHSSVKELDCLAQAVYHEARGSTRTSKILVANVVVNRVKHKDYPTTICKVIKQKGQFPWAKKKGPIKKSAEAWKDSVSIAKLVINRSFDRSKGATHFHDHRVSPKWAGKMKRVARDKDLSFYRGAK